MNFSPVAFIDVWDIAASLRDRRGAPIMPLRGYRKDTEPEDEQFGAYAATRDWQEYDDLRDRLRRLGEPMGGIEIGCVHLDTLRPGELRAWTEARPLSKWSVAHLPIRTNPQSALIAGTESATLAVGLLTVVSTLVPHAAINLGETPRIHLVIEFRKARLPIADEFRRPPSHIPGA